MRGVFWYTGGVVRDGMDRGIQKGSRKVGCSDKGESTGDNPESYECM